MIQEQYTPKAVYYGDPPPPWYRDINPQLDVTALSISDAPTTQRHAIYVEDAVDASWFLAHGNEDGLDQQIKVIPLPVCIPPQLSKGAIREMRNLREQGMLTALRGDRLTDLARPIKQEVREKVIAESPHLVELLQRVENTLTGSHLFVRAIKLDEARASTTQFETDVIKPHLHFDAEKSSLNEYSSPVYQYYANISRLPRQFRVLPIPLNEMLSILKRNQIVNEEESQSLPLETILNQFTTHFDVSLEEVVIESGQLAIFDGRVFAHDAGKGSIRMLKQGRF